MQNYTKSPIVSKLLMCAGVSALVSIASLPLSANATNYNYYKSTGANGEVYLTQFSRRGIKAELISKRGDGRQEEVGDMSGRTNAEPIKKKSKQDLQIEALKTQESKRAEQDKISRCQKMRQNLTQLNIGGKIYETAENGDRNFMTDQQIAEKRQTYQEGLDEHCSGE